MRRRDDERLPLRSFFPGETTAPVGSWIEGPEMFNVPDDGGEMDDEVVVI